VSDRRASTFVISLTAFREDGALDEAGQRGHFRRLASAGIGVYVGGSGSGEGYVLTRDERRRLFEIAREELSGRVPVRAMGVEPRSAGEVIELARDAREVGLDAIQLYSLDQGHGYRPRPEELERYLGDVLDAVDCPVVLSSHQAMGYDLPSSLVARIVERHPNVIGINFTHQALPGLVRMLEVLDGRIDLHVGGPMQALTALALGAQGFLSSEGNLAPRLCVSVIEHHRRGELAARDAAFAKVLRLFTATQRGGGMSAAKGALRRLGLPGGWPRRPRLPVEASVAADLAGCFEALGLRAVEGLDV